MTVPAGCWPEQYARRGPTSNGGLGGREIVMPLEVPAPLALTYLQLNDAIKNEWIDSLAGEHPFHKFRCDFRGKLKYRFGNDRVALGCGDRSQCAG